MKIFKILIFLDIFGVDDYAKDGSEEPFTLLPRCIAF